MLRNNSVVFEEFLVSIGDLMVVNTVLYDFVLSIFLFFLFILYCYLYFCFFYLFYTVIHIFVFSIYFILLSIFLFFLFILYCYTYFCFFYLFYTVILSTRHNSRLYKFGQTSSDGKSSFELLALVS
jgi:hypothetical protein